jgi:peptidyl-prolyl cis-trans isomerase D
MFKKLRRKTIVHITIWALVFTFVIWGVGSVAVSTKNYAGIIFGRKVSIPEYNRNYSAVLNRAKMMYGDNLPKLEKFLNLHSQTWDRIILRYEARRRLILALNSDVVQAVCAMPFFQRNGVFDKRLYGYIVENVFRVSPREFEESVRDDIIIQKLIDSITKDIKASDDDIRNSYNAENEHADVSFLLIKSDDYKNVVSVNDDEVRGFYEKNKNDFLSPIMADCQYIRIPFGDNKEDQRLTAEEMLAEIKKGKGLEDTAGEYNLEVKKTGLFSLNSSIPEIGLSYPFAAATLGLEKNQTSDIVEAQDCFYIIRLISKKPPAPLSFDEAKEKARDLLIISKSQEKALAEAGTLLSHIKNEGKALDDIAKKINAQLLTAKDITKKGYINEAGVSQSFGEVAFSLKRGEVGGPVKTEKGFAIIRLDSLKPIDEEKFAKEKDALAQKLIEDKKGESFREWFTALKKKANLKDNLKLQESIPS